MDAKRDFDPQAMQGRRTPRVMELQNLVNAAALGEDEQFYQAMEEMAELTVALNKWRRYQKHVGGTDRDRLRESVVEEIADVELMLEQLVMFLDVDDSELDEIRVRKVWRTTERIRQNGSNRGG